MNTSKIELNFEPYVMALTEQVEQYLSGLDELSAMLEQRPLSFNERSAVERSIQVIVESAIGCSKHYLKAHGKPVPSEARASIERVYEHLALTAPDINDIRGAVGMRNAIIHDYLNLDWKKLEPVVLGKKYHYVYLYIQSVMQALLNIRHS